jgi:hypothetical protein
MNIKELVEMYPNNSELGARVRELYWKQKEEQDKLMEKYEGGKIYESPDKGETIYERPLGGEISERKLIKDKSQLSIFPDSVEYTDEYYKSTFIDPYHPYKTK